MPLDTRLAALISALGADIKALYGASRYGLLAWSDDPALATSTYKPASGTLALMLTSAALSRVSGATLTVSVQVTTAGATLTAAQNLLGLYSSDGTTLTRIGVSADQSAVWTSTGLKTVSFITSAAIAMGSSLYLAVLAVGTTTPAFQAALAAPLINAGPVKRRSSVAAQTTLPASIAVSSLVAASTNVAVMVA